MGIMSIVKNVIEHFRKAGKTENEISNCRTLEARNRCAC